MSYKTLEELANHVRSRATSRRTVAVAEAADPHVLEAVRDAVKSGFVSPLLCGRRDAVRAGLAELGERPDDYEIIDADSPEESAFQAGMAIKEGRAQIIMKGLIPTNVLMKALFRAETGFRTGAHISHMNLVQIERYHKIFALCDAAVNTYPDLEQKRHILINAVNTLRRMGIDKPKVAVIASTESVNPKMPETVDAAALKEMNERGAIEGCVVEGPISYDLAMSAESALEKGYESPVAGDADLLVCPNITAANVLIKCLRYSAGAQTAGIVIGGSAPVVLTSRSAAALDKYWTMVLACSATL